MIKTIIFDWDGVLCDTVKTQFKAYSVVLEKLRLPRISFADFPKLWESDYRKFEEKIGITKDRRSRGDKIWFSSYNKLKKEVKLFPGARGFLFKIKKNYRVGLVTAGTTNRVKSELKRYKIDNIFDAVVTGDDTRKLKPDPEGLNICAKKLKTDPKDCVYIGDSRGDILAAKNAGMIPIAVSWGYHGGSILKEAKPAYLVDNFDELYKVIENFK